MRKKTRRIIRKNRGIEKIGIEMYTNEAHAVFRGLLKRMIPGHWIKIRRKGGLNKPGTPSGWRLPGAVVGEQSPTDTADD
jgi:hypothetical protein